MAPDEETGEQCKKQERPHGDKRIPKSAVGQKREENEDREHHQRVSRHA